MRPKIIAVLIQKELKIELRQGYALMGLLLYLVSSMLVAYLTFNLKMASMHPVTWAALFWIIQVFTAFNAVGKGFFQESAYRQLYYFQLITGQELIFAKIIYNTLLMLLMSFGGFGIFSLLLGDPIASLSIFFVTLISGAVGFAGALTLISAIASKAGNNATLMAILSFPIIIPMLLMVIRCTHHALDGLDFSTIYDELVILLSLNTIVFALSYILFPYIWKT
jgi:heme exporter protein B